MTTKRIRSYFNDHDNTILNTVLTALGSHDGADNVVSAIVRYAVLKGYSLVGSNYFDGSLDAKHGGPASDKTITVRIPKSVYEEIMELAHGRNSAYYARAAFRSYAKEWLSKVWDIDIDFPEIIYNFSKKTANKESEIIVTATPSDKDECNIQEGELDSPQFWDIFEWESNTTSYSGEDIESGGSEPKIYRRVSMVRFDNGLMAIDSRGRRVTAVNSPETVLESRGLVVVGRRGSDKETQIKNRSVRWLARAAR